MGHEQTGRLGRSLADDSLEADTHLNVQQELKANSSKTIIKYIMMRKVIIIIIIIDEDDDEEETKIKK